MENKAIENSARNIAPEILRKCGVTGSDFKEIWEPLCKYLAIYGCRNQRAIVEAMKTAAPEFSHISCKFFELFYQHLESIGEMDKEMIKQFQDKVLEDNSVSLEEKCRYLNEHKSEGQKWFEQAEKCIVYICGTAITISIGNKLGDCIKSKVKCDGKTHRTKERLTFFREIVPYCTPWGSAIKIQENHYRYKSGSFKKKFL